MFIPDYHNLVKAARNEKCDRIPLYEHIISPGIMERAYTRRVFDICAAKGHGVAIGSGNSIPDSVSPERYVKANRLLRRLRGESL